MHNSSSRGLCLLSVIFSTFNFSSDIPMLCFNHRGPPYLIYTASVDVGSGGAWVVHGRVRVCVCVCRERLTEGAVEGTKLLGSVWRSFC